MPTPAVNLSLSSLRTVTTKDGIKPPVSRVVALPVLRNVRPASSSNKRRADRTRAPGNWSHDWYLGYYTPGVARFVAIGSSYTSSSEGYCLSPRSAYIPASPVIGSESMQRAMQKALSGVTASQMQLNAALAQANSTGRMIGKASSHLAHGLDSAMRDPRKALPRLSSWKKIPDAFLEYLYGWRPLSEDVDNAFRELNRLRHEGMGYAMTVKGSDRVDQGFLDSQVLRPALNAGYGGGSKSIMVQRSILSRCGFTFSLPDWFMERTPTPVSPFSTGYELTRWSFVVDWFVPLGNWVGAMESAQYAPFFKEGWTSQIIRDKLRSLALESLPPSPGRTICTSCSASYKGNAGSMRRTKVTQYPWGASLPPTAMKPLPGIQQAAQGLALLSQTLQRWR